MSVVVDWVRRNAGYLVALVIAIGVSIWYFAGTSDEQADPAHVTARARARYTACMVGVPPAEANVARLRDAVIATAIAGIADWPQRCTPYAEALVRTKKYKASPRLDDTSEIERYETTSLLRADSDEPTVDFESVARDVPRPPPALPLVRAPSTLPREDAFATSEPDLKLAIGDVTCTFASVPTTNSLDPAARCNFVADAFVPPRRAMDPFHVVGDGPLIAADSRGILRDTRTGAPLLPAGADTYSASRVGKMVYALVRGKKRTLVVHDGTTAKTIVLDRPRAGEDPARIVSDHVLWSEAKGTFVRSVAGGVVGPIVTLAPQASSFWSYGGGCLAAATAGLAVQLANEADGVRHAVIRVGDQWKLVGPIPSQRLHCQSTAVVAASVELGKSAAIVTRADCTLAGCVTSTASLRGPAGPASVVPVGDEVAIAWADDFVMFARGPIATLSKAKPFPIFDGHSSSGQRSMQSMLIHDVDTFVRGSSVVVLLQSETGLALHVRDERAEPVRVRWE